MGRKRNFPHWALKSAGEKNSPTQQKVVLGEWVHSEGYELKEKKAKSKLDCWQQPLMFHLSHFS